MTRRRDWLYWALLSSLAFFYVGLLVLIAWLARVTGEVSPMSFQILDGYIAFSLCATSFFLVVRLMGGNKSDMNTYLAWLASTPWSADKPLPFLSLDRMWKDLGSPLVLTVMSLAGRCFVLVLISRDKVAGRFVASLMESQSYLWPVIGWWIGRIWVLFSAQPLAHAKRRGDWRVAAMWFLAPLLFTPTPLPSVRVLLVVLAAAALLHSSWKATLRAFPFDLPNWSLTPRQQYLAIAEKNGLVVWPLNKIGPTVRFSAISDSSALLRAAFMGWIATLAAWIAISYGAHPDRVGFFRLTGSDELMSAWAQLMTLAFVIVTALLRKVSYTWGKSPPIRWRDRVRTGQLLIPGYDRVLIAPLAVVFAAAVVFGLFSWAGVAWHWTCGVITFVSLTLAMTLGPTKEEWELTGRYLTRGAGRPTYFKASEEDADEFDPEVKAQASSPASGAEAAVGRAGGGRRRGDFDRRAFRVGALCLLLHPLALLYAFVLDRAGRQVEVSFELAFVDLAIAVLFFGPAFLFMGGRFVRLSWNSVQLRTWLARVPWDASRRVPFVKDGLSWRDFALVGLAAAVSLASWEARRRLGVGGSNPLALKSALLPAIGLFVGLGLAYQFLGNSPRHRDWRRWAAWALPPLAVFPAPGWMHLPRVFVVVFAWMLLLHEAYRRRKAEFPWAEDAWTRTPREMLVEAFREGYAGWPMSVIGPGLKFEGPPWWLALARAGMAAWWVLAVATVFELTEKKPGEMSLMAAIFVFVASVVAGLAHWGNAANNRVAPLSLRMRLRSGRLIVWGYDRAFFLGMAIWSGGSLLGAALLAVGVPARFVAAGMLFVLVLAFQKLGPDKETWELTAPMGFAMPVDMRTQQARQRAAAARSQV